MRRKRKPVKPVKCGMLFSGALMQPEDLKTELSAEASQMLGNPDINDALVFQKLSVGLHVQFKTDWEPDSDGFTICRDNGSGAADFQEDMICMLTTEKENPKLNSRLNLPFLEGKRVLEWDRVKKLVRLGTRIAVRHASFLEAKRRAKVSSQPEGWGDTSLCGDDFQLWVIGDSRWLPEPFMRNHVRVGEGEKSAVIVSLSEHDL